MATNYNDLADKARNNDKQLVDESVGKAIAAFDDVLDGNHRSEEKVKYFTFVAKSARTFEDGGLDLLEQRLSFGSAARAEAPALTSAEPAIDMATQAEIEKLKERLRLAEERERSTNKENDELIELIGEALGSAVVTDRNGRIMSEATLNGFTKAQADQQKRLKDAEADLAKSGDCMSSLEGLVENVAKSAGVGIVRRKDGAINTSVMEARLTTPCPDANEVADLKAKLSSSDAELSKANKENADLKAQLNAGPSTTVLPDSLKEAAAEGAVKATIELFEGAVHKGGLKSVIVLPANTVKAVAAGLDARYDTEGAITEAVGF